MKKAFDQTVRDLKREVNKKVLKVPGIEQKILDATSNEPWGPHGSHLADLAQATRNYHEYQMIMHVIWKRINDTGKNWRHVYKALTVLDYLVAHGSERVIDEIKEHAYQISTLSGFQYIDSSGRDQGSNVRRKSQSLVSLVNDKERIQEVRQKALTNRDKFRNSPGQYRPSSYPGSGGYGDRYDDDHYEGRYGSRDDDRNGSGKERDWDYRDDDRYGRGGDSYARDGDKYGRDSDERYGRDGYRDDDYRGGRGSDEHRFGPRNRSFERERSFDDDDRHSSRNGGGRADDPSQDERRIDRKLSEQNVGAPPSYEDVTSDGQNHAENARDGETITPSAPKTSSPTAPATTSPQSANQAPGQVAGAFAPFPSEGAAAFDEFDPRGFVPAPPPDANSLEMDLFGSLSASDPINSLALIPVTSSTTAEADVPSNSGFTANNFVAPSFSSNAILNQPSENPFGDDTPFRAVPQDNFSSQQHFSSQQQPFAQSTSFQPSLSNGGTEPVPSMFTNMETVASFNSHDALPGITYTPSVADGQHFSATPGSFASEYPVAQASSSVLDSILPQSVPAAATPTNIQTVQLNMYPQSGLSAPIPSQPASMYAQPGLPAPLPSQPALLAPQLAQPIASTNVIAQYGLSAPLSSQVALHTAAAAAPLKAQESKDKFETKSTVWADTLSRGLVNLNISGPKTNPLADIGVDFDAINRMEKRKEKVQSSATPVTSTITMGKAMGSGSGMGRAGSSSMAPPPNPMMGSGMGMGMGMGGGAGMGRGMGMGMAGYGGQQPMGMGMGMNMNMGMGMGMGMNMGMAQGAPTLPPTGMPPGPGMPGVGYNPMMGMGGYGSQQPYGGGHR